jgi:hypothetical protein
MMRKIKKIKLLSPPGCTAERFFRIDRAQENLHYVSDIANDLIFVLDSSAGQDSSEGMSRSRNMSVPNAGPNDEYFEHARDHANYLEREKKKSITLMYHDQLVLRLFGEKAYYLPVEDVYDD